VIQFPRPTLLTCRLLLSGLFAACGCGLPIAHALATSASEHSNLAIMIRQLNTLRDTARRSVQVANVVLHDQVITFNPEHFLALINVSEDWAYRPRKKVLVAMAQKILAGKP